MAQLKACIQNYSVLRSVIIGLENIYNLMKLGTGLRFPTIPKHR